MARSFCVRSFHAAKSRLGSRTCRPASLAWRRASERIISAGNSRRSVTTRGCRARHADRPHLRPARWIRRFLALPAARCADAHGQGHHADRAWQRDDADDLRQRPLYAPISLPQDIAVLPPDGPPVAFQRAAVAHAQSNANAALALSGQDCRRLEDQRDVLTRTMALVEAALSPRARADRFKLVLDTVWWRRVGYFVSLFLVTFAAAFPLLAEYLQIGGVADLNDRAGGPVGWAVGLVK